MDINIKDLDETTVDKLNKLAEDAGISRSEFLKRQLGKFTNSHYLFFRASSQNRQELEKRIRSGHTFEEYIAVVADNSLNRYFDLLDRASLEEPHLVEGEACLLIDVYNGTIIDFRIDPKQNLLITVDDYFALSTSDNKYCKKWKVSKVELINKIQQVSTLKAAFILDCIEQFWERSEYYSNQSYKKRFQELRLIK